jgi:hypothetical protein
MFRAGASEPFFTLGKCITHCWTLPAELRIFTTLKKYLQYFFEPQVLGKTEEGRGLLYRAGNFGYPRLRDTVAAVLQKAYERSSPTTEHLL